MAMKDYTKFPKFPSLESPYQMQLCVMQGIRCGVLQQLAYSKAPMHKAAWKN